MEDIAEVVGGAGDDFVASGIGHRVDEAVGGGCVGVDHQAVDHEVHLGDRAVGVAGRGLQGDVLADVHVVGRQCG